MKASDLLSMNGSSLFTFQPFVSSYEEFVEGSSTTGDRCPGRCESNQNSLAVLDSRFQMGFQTHQWTGRQTREALSPRAGSSSRRIIQVALGRRTSGETSYCLGSKRAYPHGWVENHRLVRLLYFC